MHNTHTFHDSSTELPPDTEETTERRPLVPIAILLCGLLGTALLIFLKPVPPKEQPEKEAALVSTVIANPGSVRPIIGGYGSVEPRRELLVQPQVGGTIVDMHSKLEPGGIIPEDDTLFKIDPRDYEIQVTVQEAAVARAEFDLELEKGNQIVAKKEWELLRDSTAKNFGSADLALRKPHLQEKEAALKAAKSNLEKAKLDLSRTELRAPFSALVVEESVELGRYVSPQSSLTRLVAADTFYIQARVPVQELRWLRALESEDYKPTVHIIDENAPGGPRSRLGTFVRVRGDVDPDGRMGRIIVAVTDPLNLKKADDVRPILLGTYVKVEIEGRELQDVIKIPRVALREGNLVWIVSKDNTLVKLPVSIVFYRENDVFVRGELPQNAQVITSPLQTALEGMNLEINSRNVDKEQSS